MEVSLIKERFYYCARLNVLTLLFSFFISISGYKRLYLFLSSQFPNCVKCNRKFDFTHRRVMLAYCLLNKG